MYGIYLWPLANLWNSSSLLRKPHLDGLLLFKESSYGYRSGIWTLDPCISKNQRTNLINPLVLWFIFLGKTGNWKYSMLNFFKFKKKPKELVLTHHKHTVSIRTGQRTYPERLVLGGVLLSQKPITKRLFYSEFLKEKKTPTSLFDFEKC